MKLIINIIILTVVYSINAQELEHYDLDSININNWMNTPHVKGRLATKDDVKKNRAVHISSGIEKYIPVDLEIPFLACLIDPRTERKDTVVVIQACKINEGIYTGYRSFHGGGYGTAFLKSLIIINNDKEN